MAVALKDFERAEYESRWQRTRVAMRAAAVDALLVTTQSNYRYLSGHRSVQFSIDRRPMMLLLTLNSDPILLICRAEVANAEVQTWLTDVRAYSGLSVEAPVLASLIYDQSLEGARIGIELGPTRRLGIGYSLLEQTKQLLPRAQLVDSSPILNAVRMVKSEAEIGRIDAACKIATAAYEAIASRAHPGMTVAECERLCLEEMIGAGADIDVPPIVTFGSLPPDHAFETGEVFKVDLALAHRGYRADMTRRAVFGGPNNEVRRMHEEVCSIHQAVLGELHPGRQARDIGQAFEKIAASLGHDGLAEGEWIGHGVGLDLLERPSLDKVDQTELEAGMVLTPEPWFRAAGGVVMLEDTVVIAETGCRVLTQPMQGDIRVLST